MAEAVLLDVGVSAEQRRNDLNQYLTFVLGGEMFALDILRIKEILEYEVPTEVPMMPAFVRGVCNVRGTVVPIIDLSARFGRASTAVTRKTCIVIVEISSNGRNQVWGVLVDAVNEVRDIALTDIEPAPSFGFAVRTDFISGIGKLSDKFVVIINVDRVLSTDEVETLEPTRIQ